MPDGRFISKSIAVNGQLASISLEADYLFARCIPHLDRDGRMNGEPAIVKATACPLRREISEDVTPDLIRQLAGAGLVRWYQVGAQKVIEFPGFRTHQRGMKYDREAPSRLPAFDSEGAIDLAAPTTPAKVRTNSGPAPAKVRDVAPTSLNSEVNLSEVNLSLTDSGSTRVEPVDENFERLWKDRPRREGSDPKKEARKAWNGRLKEGIDPAVIIAAHARYRRWCEATRKIGTEKVMRCSTFLGDPEHFSNPWGASEAKGTAVPDRKDELRRCLAMARNQDPDFRGGAPDLYEHGFELRRGDEPIWNEVLAEAGLEPMQSDRRIA